MFLCLSSKQSQAITPPHLPQQVVGRGVLRGGHLCLLTLLVPHQPQHQERERSVQASSGRLPLHPQLLW
ncbi:hypothetical protein JZ751_023286 [Albula glossodonta]|uniref:Uncharacterized protein n=1 Tax=Albula glossodonta TaxID=121402 RepID=A0A8T2PHM7_9TELE|nr:hypothetical protein JZ751_023286 [Albula glossodonta]